MADPQVIRNLANKYATALESVQQTQDAINATQRTIDQLNQQLAKQQAEALAAEQALKGAA